MSDDEQTVACDLLYGYVPYIKRNIPWLERRGVKKHVLYWLEYQSVISE